MKYLRFLLISTLATILSISPILDSTANASISDGVSVEYVDYSVRTMPTIHGRVPYSCTDVVIGIANDPVYFYGLTGASYFTVPALDSMDLDKSWSLSLVDKNFGLINNHYTIQVSCGQVFFGGHRLYEKIFTDLLYVYPQSCDDTGVECEAIHRFYNTIEGTHFYTASQNEKHQLMMSTLYRYEGVTGFGTASPYSGSLAVHRFYNKRTGTHFYTSNQAEASRVNDTMSAVYRYEGVAFYADATQQYDSTPMHRFYKFKQGVHFYTSSQSEASVVNDTMASTYRYEGATFYIIKNQ